MENKSWKESNSLIELQEKVVREVNENHLDEMESMVYISENLGVSLDDAYDIMLESQGIVPESREELLKEINEMVKQLPIANLPDKDGMVVVPASWRED